MRVKDDISIIERTESILNSKTLLNHDLYTDDGFITFDPDHLNLNNVFELREIAEVTQGVVQNPDKVSMKMSEKHNLVAGEGVLVVTEQELKDMNLSEDEKKLIGHVDEEYKISKFYISTVQNYRSDLTKTN